MYKPKIRSIFNFFNQKKYLFYFFSLIVFFLIYALIINQIKSYTEVKENNFKYINDGSRSISHLTNIQDFLIQKFKFRKAYCKLHILYNCKTRIFVNLLFPFRKIIRIFNFDPFTRIEILLYQEEIYREEN